MPEDHQWILHLHFTQNQIQCHKYNCIVFLNLQQWSLSSAPSVRTQEQKKGEEHHDIVSRKNIMTYGLLKSGWMSRKQINEINSQNVLYCIFHAKIKCQIKMSN